MKIKMFNLKDMRDLHKIALSFYETVDSLETFTYKKVYADSIEVEKILDEILPRNLKDDDGAWLCYNIAVLFSMHSPAILPAIIGVTNAGGASCFIDPTEHCDMVINRIIKFQTNVVLCDLYNFKKFKFQQEDTENIKKYTLRLSNRDCVLFQMKAVQLSPKKIPVEEFTDVMTSSNVLFYALTSGSCGQTKAIGVTYKCFMTNVLALGKLYAINEQDVIFVSSPPTFDPFMVDICLALHHGTTLVMVNNSIRLAPNLLLAVLFPSEPKPSHSATTVLQTTPSLFMRWTADEIKNRILIPSSRLRILALGGEPFPSLNEITKWQNWHENCKLKRIFNLYGLTEMSCWTSVHEISRNDVLLRQTIPIGQPIDGHTHFSVNPNGELMLKTKIRKCFQTQLSDDQVFDKNYEFILHTGDLVDAESETKLLYKARVNSAIKFYGRKVNLHEIETIGKNVNGVQATCCVHDEVRQLIILFVIVDPSTEVSSCDIQRQITQSLKVAMISAPIEFYRVNKFPLTAHGKRSKRELLKQHERMERNDLSNKTLILIFITILNKLLGTSIEMAETTTEALEKRPKTESDLSFIELGGTSLKAIQIVNDIERITSNSFPQLLLMLLNDKISIKEIFFHLKNEEEMQTRKSTAKSRVILKILELKYVNWSIDMRKCIDATATVCHISNNTIVVSIGSHSKLLYNVLASDGTILSKLELPDRIESQVTQLGDFGIVGCYDGFLYCFDIFSGQIQWKFNSNGMIKCRALVTSSQIIFGNYNDANNLWCLSKDNGILISCSRIGTKSIYANPVEMNDENFIACSLDGTIACVNTMNNSIIWKTNVNSPIFSTPSVVRDEKRSKLFIIVASVNGTIHCLNSSDGNHVWSHQIDGNIFSSLVCFEDSHGKNVVNIVFGSHNRFLYMLNFNTENLECCEHWRIEFDSQIRSTSTFVEFLGKKCIVSCSTGGTVAVNEADTGKFLYRMKIDGQIFSSPAVLGNKLFIGSRNNSLYCIDWYLNLCEANLSSDKS